MLRRADTEHKGTSEIRTARCLLRKLKLEDAADLYRLGCLGSSPEEADRFARDIIGDYGSSASYNWVIEYENRAVGRIKVIEISQRDNYMQIAYDIAEAYRNMGLMTECVKAVLRFLLTQVKAHRVYGQCRRTNPASARVMEKSGMKLEGCQRGHYIEKDGAYSDVFIYGIIREDLEENI